MKSSCYVLCLLLITCPLFVISSNTFEQKVQDISKLSSYDLLTLPLEVDQYGNYYIETNLNFSSNTLATVRFKDTTVTDIGKMLVILYSNETFIASCSKFLASTPKPFDNIHTNISPRSVDFLYDKMRLSGFDVHLDIQTPAFAFMKFPGLHAVHCDSGFKGGVHGYIGLGSGHNMLSKTLNNFSIILNNNKETGSDLALYIGSHDALRQKYGKPTSLTTAKTKNNWALTMIDLKLTLPDDEFTTTLNTVSSYNVIFDLNSEIIGVPTNIYTFITTILRGYNIDCLEDGNETKCKVGQVNVAKLPTFGLVLSESTTEDNVISIPPKLYFDKAKNRLLIKSLSSDKSGHLKVNPSFSRSVVLGAPFMRYYNVHFSHGHESNFVTIEESRPLSSVNGTYISIAIGVALVAYFLVVVVGYMCFMRHSKESNFKKQASDKLDNSTALLKDELTQEDKVIVTVPNKKAN